MIRVQKADNDADQRVGHDDKIAMLNILVHRLPAPNFHILDALVGYLVEVTENADSNKMNIRNRKLPPRTPFSTKGARS